MRKPALQHKGQNSYLQAAKTVQSRARAANEGTAGRSGGLCYQYTMAEPNSPLQLLLFPIPSLSVVPENNLTLQLCSELQQPKPFSFISTALGIKAHTSS